MINKPQQKRFAFALINFVRMTVFGNAKEKAKDFLRN
jgi:hypothetical protein